MTKATYYQKSFRIYLRDQAIGFTVWGDSLEIEYELDQLIIFDGQGGIICICSLDSVERYTINGEEFKVDPKLIYNEAEEVEARRLNK